MEINENKLKEILDEQRNEFQHFMGIIKEDFDSKIGLIGEQYGTIKEMMGTIAEDMQIVKSDIEFIKGSLRKKVDYDEFQALERRVAMLESKVRK